MQTEFTKEEKQFFYKGYSDGYSNGLDKGNADGYVAGVRNERFAYSKLLCALKDVLFAGNKSELFLPALADPEFALKLAKIYLHDTSPEKRASEMAIADRRRPYLPPGGDEKCLAELADYEKEYYVAGVKEARIHFSRLLCALKERLANENKLDWFDRALSDPYYAYALAEIYLPSEFVKNLPTMDKLDEEIDEFKQGGEPQNLREEFILRLYEYEREMCATGALCGRGGIWAQLRAIKERLAAENKMELFDQALADPDYADALTREFFPNGLPGPDPTDAKS